MSRISTMELANPLTGSELVEVVQNQDGVLKNVKVPLSQLFSQGEDGKNAFEVAKDNGFVGTVSDWLASLKGTDGEDGANGKSIYELAVDAGYTGTQEEWMEEVLKKPTSLVRRTVEFTNNGVPGHCSVIAMGTQEDIDALTITQTGGNVVEISNVPEGLMLKDITVYYEDSFNPAGQFTVKYPEPFGETVEKFAHIPIMFMYGNLYPSVLGTLTTQNYELINGIVNVQKVGLVVGRGYRWLIKVV